MPDIAPHDTSNSTQATLWCYARAMSRLPLAPLSLLIVAWGCLSDGSGGTAYCRQITETLEGCGLIPEGTQFHCIEPVQPSQRCVAQCLLNESCSALEGLFCFIAESPSLRSCAQSCNDPREFTCKDDTEDIPNDYVCDGYADCADASDEQDCPSSAQFFCADDSSTIPSSWKCDGAPDCSDASDELGCPMRGVALDEILICPS